jgi:hypothetical protein
VTERANRGVLAVDELAAQLERHVREFLVVDRPDAAAETFARFEEVHRRAAGDQVTRGRQPGESAADDDDTLALQRGRQRLGTMRSTADRIRRRARAAMVPDPGPGRPLPLGHDRRDAHLAARESDSGPDHVGLFHQSR